jgi:hypothetical protein
MEFRLFYRGPLKSNGNPAEKQMIRRQFHPQLKKLWSQEPLVNYVETEKPKEGYFNTSTNYLDENSETNLIYPLSKFKFACLVSERLNTHAELDILFLRPEPPGKIIQTGGDIDNRLKTLFDGLRRPIIPNEIYGDDFPKNGEDPFYCLLADDALISKVTVATDQLLDVLNPCEVVLIIHVRLKARLLDSLCFVD